jgi:hypothetical protein
MITVLSHMVEYCILGRLPRSNPVTSSDPTYRPRLRTPSAQCSPPSDLLQVSPSWPHASSFSAFFPEEFCEMQRHPLSIRFRSLRIFFKTYSWTRYGSRSRLSASFHLLRTSCISFPFMARLRFAFLLFT